MKTPKEFDYDLWKSEEGKCFIRVKTTGEVSQVNQAIFKELRNEAMRMYRRQKGVPVYGVENGKSIVMGHSTTLSLDANSNEKTESSWARGDNDFTEDIITDMLEQEFRKTLTAKQLDVYLSCLIGGISASDYAIANGIKPPSVFETISFIRKKAKKFFDLP